MVTVLQAPERKKSFGSMLGERLGEGIERGAAQGMNFAQQLGLEKARGRGLAQETKQMEKIKSIEMGLGTIDQMRSILKKGNLGRGSAFSGLFSEDVRRDRAQYEQLGRSLIPLVSTGMRVTNKNEFEEYKKVLTDPSASDAEIEGALDGLQDVLSRNASLDDNDFESKIMGKDKKKRADFHEPFELAEESLESPKEQGKLSSVASAAGKGLIKGGRGFSLLPNLGAINTELAENLMERFLPSKQGGLEDVLEFAGENVPMVAAGEGGLIKKGIQALLGGALKSGAKSVNLPAPVQEAANIAGLSGPALSKAALSKTLKPSASQKEVVDFLRSKGLTEKQITPIIQDEKKLSSLSKIAFKYSKKNKFIKEIKSGVQGIYDDIYARGSHLKLTGNGLDVFLKDMNAAIDKLNPRYKDALRKELDVLQSEPITFKTLGEFEDAANDALINKKGGVRAALSLKDPAKKAMKYLDRNLYKEHQLTDAAYSKTLSFIDNMTKKQADGLLKLEKINPAVAAAVTLKFAAMPKLAALGIVAPFAARQFLTNPRLQRIHAKMLEELGKNKIPQVLKLAEVFEKEFSKQDHD